MTYRCHKVLQCILKIMTAMTMWKSYTIHVDLSQFVSIVANTETEDEDCNTYPQCNECVDKDRIKKRATTIV